MNRKHNHIGMIVFGAATVAWMVVIFMYSAKDAAQSTVQSYRVGMLFGRLVKQGFTTLAEDEQLLFAQRWDHVIRKGAHMTEFAILCNLFTGFFANANIKYNRIKRALFAYVCTVLYAATDEFHQLFVPGRAGQIKDVCIDGAGALIGLLLAVLVWRIIYVTKRKNEQKRNT